MKAGIIINLNSTRTKRAMWWIRRLQKKHSSDIIWRTTANLDEAERTLEEMCNLNVDVLLLCGGDGTVQKALTTIQNRLYHWRPALCHIPGGATNVLAKNLGIESGPARALRGFIKKHIVEKKPLTTIPAVILRVEDEELPEPLYGITFTNGILFELIKKYLNMTPGMRSVMKVVYSTLTEFIMNALRGEDIKAEYFKRIPVKMVIDNKPYPYGEILASLATVLPNPLMWFNPFYMSNGLPRSGFYFLANSMSNREIFRHLFPLLTGRFPGTKAYNGIAREVIMETTHGYAVDGEPVFCETRRTVKIKSGPVFNFVTMKRPRKIKKERRWLKHS